MLLPYFKIREQDPLKQGLKLNQPPISYRFLFIREQDPLKQGLKLPPLILIPMLQQIREQDPLKQGLKQHYKFIFRD